MSLELIKSFIDNVISLSTFIDITIFLYSDTTTDSMVLLVKSHEKKKTKYSISKESHKFVSQLDLIP